MPSVQDFIDKYKALAGPGAADTPASYIRCMSESVERYYNNGRKIV